MGAEKENPIIDEIKGELRKLNAILTFVVYCLFFLLLKFLYETLIEISAPSIAAILTIIAFILVFSMSMFKALARKAIRNISDYAAKCDALLRFTKDIRTEEAYIDILLGKILEHAMTLIKAETGLVLLLEEDKFVLKAARGVQADTFSGKTFSLEEGIIGQILTNNRIVRVEDAADADRLLPRVDTMVHSLLSAPLHSGKSVMGAIVLINKLEQKFNSDDEAAINYFAEQAAISLENARFHEDQKNYEIHVTELLMQAMDSHLPIKREHSEKVAQYSQLIAQGINLPFERRKELHLACLLHDIGFIKYPPTAEMEQKVYLKHVEAGFNLLKSINFFRKVAPIVLHHHERYDGTGYPAGLKGEAIPLESRIIAIAEAFDVLTNEKSYRRSMGYAAVLQEMRENAETQFDPELLAVFIREVERVIPELYVPAPA